MEIFDKSFGEQVSGDRKRTVVKEVGDVVAFARERLGFDPDAKQEWGCAAGGGGELYAAMGEVHCDRG